MRPRILSAVVSLALLAHGCLITKPLDDGWIEYRGQPKRVNEAISACHPREQDVLVDRGSALGTSTATITNTTYEQSYGTRTATTTTTSTEVGLPVPGWKVVRVRGCTECVENGHLCGYPYRVSGECCSGHCGVTGFCE